jgi:glycine reductase
MVREMERLGLPTVLFSAVPAIPLAFGASRIIPAKAIRYPLGDPDRPPEHERQLRRQMVETGLRVLQTPCDRSTIFPVAG